jgi:mevalonate kinase
MRLSWGNSVRNFQRHINNTTKLTNKQTKKIVDQTAADVLRFAKTGTPRRTGKLVSGWRIIKRGSGEKRKVFIENLVKYAIYVEHGTSKQAPRRMMLKALIRGQRRMKRRLEILKRKMSQTFNRG